MDMCVASNSSNLITSSLTPASSSASRKAVAPRSRYQSSLVPASIQIARTDLSASAYLGTIRTGSQSSQRCQTSGRSTPVTQSNGSSTVPSSRAEKQAATPSIISSVPSPSLVNETRELKSDHQRQMSPS